MLSRAGPHRLLRPLHRTWTAPPAAAPIGRSHQRGYFTSAVAAGQRPAFLQFQGMFGSTFVPLQSPEPPPSPAPAAAPPPLADVRVTVRQSDSTLTDIAILRDFYESLDAETYAARFHCKPRGIDIQNAADELCGQPHAMCFDDESGALIGVVTVQNKGHNDVELSATILPAYRKNGVGMKLLEQAEAMARKQQKRSMWAEVQPEGIGAQRLLVKAGFGATQSRESGEVIFQKYISEASGESAT
jgi:ribosomal protein S18 acetylase RimI-like enzyme